MRPKRLRGCLVGQSWGPEGMSDSHSNRLVGGSRIPIPEQNGNGLIPLKPNTHSSLMIQISIPILFTNQTLGGMAISIPIPIYFDSNSSREPNTRDSLGYLKHLFLCNIELI